MPNALFSSRSDDWATPQATFDGLHTEFGFALDVCASATNRKCHAYYGLDHIDPVRRDGLTNDWAAEVGDRAAWCNPPYGTSIGLWMAKAAASAARGAIIVSLVPVRSDTAWWHDNVMAAAAEVRLVRRRLRFGDGRGSAPFPSAVVVFRPGARGAGQPVLRAA